ncbi:MAG: tetratricopeptide repeat protein [Phycisphaerae bacterium]|nr:tetratricopeptide repeat protein [Phycisphaerae bacterium]
MRRTDGYLLIGVLIVGAALRIGYLAEFARGPDFASPGVDAEFHDYWARGMATGDWTPPADYENPNIQGTPFLRPPGYPYFLAAIYRCFGTGYLMPRVVQMALGLAGAALAFIVGRRWFGRVTGAVWAALMAVYWAFIYFEAEFHAPVLMIFLTLTLTFAMGRWAEKPSPGRAALSGVLFGLSALVLPNVLLFGPFAFGWMLFVTRRRAAAPPTAILNDHGRTACREDVPVSPFLRGLLHAIVFSVAAAAAISPATIRNYRVCGQFIPITTNAGINLYIGNHDGAEGYCLVEIPELGRFETCFDYPALVRRLTAKLGRPLSDPDVDRYFRDEAMRFIREHPAEFVRLTLRKALMFWGPSEVSHNKEDELERRHYTALHVVPIGFGFVFATAVAGVAVFVIGRRGSKEALRRIRGVETVRSSRSIKDDTSGPTEIGAALQLPLPRAIAGLMLLYIVSFFLSILPFFNAGRYRVPIIPFLLFFSAIGAASVMEFATRRRAAAFGVVGVCAAACLAMVLWPFRHEPDVSNWHYARGLCLSRTNRPEVAVKEYEAAIRADSANAKAHYNLGLLMQARGDLALAAAHFDAVAATGQYQLESQRQQARILYQAGRLDDAAALLESLAAAVPDDADSVLMLAAVRMDQHRWDDAAACYRRLVALRPDDADLRYNLGSILSDAGRTEESVDSYRAAIALKPAFFEAYNNLAAAQVRLNRLDEAASAFRSAVGVNPGSREARLNLAYVLGRLGRHDERVAILSDWLTQYGDDIEIRLRLGDALLDAGRPNDAVPHFEAVLRADPGNAAATERLANLRS